MQGITFQKGVDMQSIREIFKINTVEELNAARDQFEQEIYTKTEPLVVKLDQNILSSDVASIEQHMAYVESWRARLVKYHAFASAFTDHAKDSTFLAAKDSGDTKRIPEIERDAFRRKLSGGFSALQGYLEGLIDSIDSRVNLSKKVLGIEVDGGGKRTI
jgi:hypothetical protein